MTVAMVASSLSSVARSGHQEDDDYPALARRWRMTLATSLMTRERTALISETVLGMGDEGGMTSGFQPQLVFVAFRAGIG